MFPTFIPYVNVAAPRNVSPCAVDFVGNNANPALWYGIDATNIAFRMRLNGSPLNPNNPNVLDEFVWGVEIRDINNNLLFTARVDASGNNPLNDNRVQVLDAAGNIIYDAPIVLGPNGNVNVTSAGTIFPCGNPVVPDEDFFLDFQIPLSAFVINGQPFNFDAEVFKLCYFTSTNDQNINKEFICGNLINLPPERPALTVEKDIISGPAVVNVNQVATWNLRITLTNPSTVPVTGIVVTDNINPEIILAAPVTATPSVGTALVVGKLITWTVGTLAPSASATLNITLTGSFPTTGHKILDSGVVTTTTEGVGPLSFHDIGIDVVAPGRGIKLQSIRFIG